MTILLLSDYKVLIFQLQEDIAECKHSCSFIVIVALPSLIFHVKLLILGEGEGLVVETSILVSLILFLSLSIYLERTNQRNEMKQGRDKKPSFPLCWSLGMFVGIILGTAIGQLAVGIALGGMSGIMYHLLFAKPNQTKDDEER